MSPNVPEMEGMICQWMGDLSQTVPLVEFIYLLFIRMPGESYRSLSCVCVTSFERQLTPLLVDSAARVPFLFQIVSVQL